MEKIVLRLDPELAKRYLKANALYGRESVVKALAVVEEWLGKYGSGNGAGLPKVWVYASFEHPNLVLESINRLHKRFPRLALWLVSSANAEFLLMVYLFAVTEDGTSITITDFVRI